MGRITALGTKLDGNMPLSLSEQREAVSLARYYRRMLAMKIAESAYQEMKDYAQIDEEIRPLGYRLVKIINSRIPVLEEIKQL